MTYIVRDHLGRDVAGDETLDDEMIATAERYAGTIVDTATNAAVYVATASEPARTLDDEGPASVAPEPEVE